MIKKFFTVLLLGLVGGVLAQTGGMSGGMTGGMSGGAPTVEGTIELFDEGIAEVPLDTALANIRSWEETLRAADSEDLTMIADTLAQLSEALQADSVDTTTVAGLLSQLGDETRTVAQGAQGAGADADMADQLLVLASLLTQVGQQFSTGVSGGTGGSN